MTTTVHLDTGRINTTTLLITMFLSKILPKLFVRLTNYNLNNTCCIFQNAPKLQSI